MEISRKKCCCDEMYNAVSLRNNIPIYVELCGDAGSEFYRFNLELVNFYRPEPQYDDGSDEAAIDIDFCPFCGRQVFSCKVDFTGKWKKEKNICEDFLWWFRKNVNGEFIAAPTPMFKYEPRENQFYMHYRKGFGEGWIPITYCIYCGEPLSEMVEKYGIPKVISDQLNHFE
jgi:hypothetical protein